MRRAEAASNRVTIGTGSILEFRDVAGGDVNGILAGGRVLFTSSTLTLRGANTVRDFEAAAGADLTIDGAGSLGGAGADVTVSGGARLRLTKPQVLARNMLVDGGAIVVATYYNMTALKLAGALDFANGGEIRLGGLLPTGIYTAATADAGIAAMPSYNPNQDGMFMVVDIVDGKRLQLTAYNMALEPGKDVNVGYDSMAASMRSVYAHVTEDFLDPLVDRKAGAGAGSLWFRAIGSFAEYGDDAGHLGWRDTTWVGVLGCDYISQKNFMLGAYFGCADTSLSTSNNATADISLPHWGIYSALRAGDLYFAANVSGGAGGADTVRREEQGNIVTGGYDLDTRGAGIEAGIMLHPFADGGLRPSVGLRFTRLNFHNYRESGLGAVRLDNFKTRALEAVFSCDLTRQITLPWGRPGLVNVRVGWRENLRSDQTESYATMVDYPDARFRIRGDSYDGSGITCGLGLRAALTNRTALGLAYDFEYIPMKGRDNDTVRNTINAAVRVTW
jgi:outer membrane autotransporter protein